MPHVLPLRSMLTRPLSIALLTLCVALAVGFGEHLFGARAVPAKAPAPAANGVPREAMLLLKSECFSCHNEKKKKGGLVMTSREALLIGSDSGVVAEPGNASSLLA